MPQSVILQLHCRSGLRDDSIRTTTPVGVLNEMAVGVRHRSEIPVIIVRVPRVEGDVRRITNFSAATSPLVYSYRTWRPSGSVTDVSVWLGIAMYTRLLGAAMYPYARLVT